MREHTDLLKQVQMVCAGILEKLHKAVSVFLAFGMALIMFLVVFHVFGRYFFGKTYMGTMELVRYTMIWISMLGAAAAFGVKEHPCIDFMRLRMPPRIWVKFNMLGYLMLCLFLIGMIIGGFEIAVKNWHQTSLGLQIPMFYPYLGIPVGGMIILPYVFMDMLNAIITARGEKESHL